MQNNGCLGGVKESLYQINNGERSGSHGGEAGGGGEPGDGSEGSLCVQTSEGTGHLRKRSR